MCVQGLQATASRLRLASRWERGTEIWPVHWQIQLRSTPRGAQRRWPCITQRQKTNEARARSKLPPLPLPPPCPAVYTVKVCRHPSCTCPDFVRGNLCKHVLFVMMRVLKQPATNPLIWQVRHAAASVRTPPHAVSWGAVGAGRNHEAPCIGTPQVGTPAPRDTTRLMAQCTRTSAAQPAAVHASPPPPPPPTQPHAACTHRTHPRPVATCARSPRAESAADARGGAAAGATGRAQLGAGPGSARQQERARQLRSRDGGRAGTHTRSRG